MLRADPRGQIASRTPRTACSARAPRRSNSKPQFAVEGSVFVAGAVIQWLRDELGLIRHGRANRKPSPQACRIPAAFMLSRPSSAWARRIGIPRARGIISGLTRASGKAHIVRAALESIAFQSTELIDAMEADSGETIRELRVDGGAAVNNFLMQFQADILGKPVVRPVDVETTALGAAYLAGIAEGVWSGVEEVESFWRVERRFEPQMPADRRTSSDERLAQRWRVRGLTDAQALTYNSILACELCF